MALANSLKFAQDEVQKLAEPLPEPPQRLSAAALIYWSTVIGAKRRSAWTDSDLILACALCRDMALIETLSAQLEEDGPTLENKDGRLYPHPAGTLLDATTRRVLATTRSLQIHAGATVGKTDHQANKNTTARNLAERFYDAGELIARPGNA